MNAIRIFVAVSCFNRRRTAELCLPTLRAALGIHDFLVCDNDGSTEYDAKWLRQWADYASDWPNLGIEAQRRQHLLSFWQSDAEWLYLTDHDAIHDPSALERAIEIHHKYRPALLCLYNTNAHVRLKGNTLEDNPNQEVVWRRFAPGVSYFMSRASVAHVMPIRESLTAFDWQIPTILGGRCAVSRHSFLDHLGFGGLRHPANEGPDGGDRALTPTHWLVEKRAEVVSKLSC